MTQSTSAKQLKRATEILESSDVRVIQARRTAFVARFIVLREAKRTKAHRVIEEMAWKPETTAEELAHMFRQAFIENGDNMSPVERDIRRALAHANRSLVHFIEEYSGRATLSFIDSLFDYDRSNSLLFGEDDSPKCGGWRLPSELKRIVAEKVEGRNTPEKSQEARE